MRRIAALEAGLTCLLGSVVATVFAALLLLSQWQHPPATVWAGFALVMVAVPLLGVLVSTLALRRVIASPLGWVRRVRPQPGKGRGPGLAFIAAALVLLTVGLVITPGTFGGFGTAPLLIFTVVVVTGMGAVWLTGATARLTGRLLAARTGNPATLIAAERLRDDPWAAARTHAAVLLVTVVGTAFVGIRQTLLAGLTGRDRRMFADNMSFYTTGINLTGAAILVALGITLAGLAVGTAESLAARRRGLSAQAAAGVPRPVLAKALLLETALPLAPRWRWPASAASASASCTRRRSVRAYPCCRCWCRRPCTRPACSPRRPPCRVCAARYTRRNCATPDCPARDASGPAATGPGRHRTRDGPAPGHRGLPGPDRKACGPKAGGQYEGPGRQAEMPSIRAIASSAPYGCR